MLKLTSLIAHEGVLLTRAQVTGQRQAKNILSEACLHAKKMIKQAGIDAEKIRKQAYAEGYQQGVITAAKQIKKYINVSNALSEKLNIVLVKRAKKILSTALDHPDILIILVDEWLRKLDKKSVVNDDLLHLILPLSAKKKACAITRIP